MHIIFHLMRQLLTFIFTIAIAVSHGQSFTYPSIKSMGKTITDFIPVGWIVLDSAYGDLNKDGLKDAAIVLQHKDSVAIVKDEEDTALTQPRILLILFKNAGDNGYQLTEQSNSFILNHDNASMDDPYQELSINKDVLEVKFYVFYNMGSWYIINASYKFRYFHREFVLIGADNSSFHRATHDYEYYSYNFLTKKRILIKGNDNNGTKKTSTKAITISTLKTIKTLKEPFTWEVEKNIYL